MKEEFIITILYKGQPMEMTGQLLLQGFTHKFKVKLEDKELFFEPDEEGHYRAVKMPWQEEKKFSMLDKNLLSAIQQQIEAILA